MVNVVCNICCGPILLNIELAPFLEEEEEEEEAQCNLKIVALLRPLYNMNNNKTVFFFYGTVIYGDGISRRS